MKKLLTLSIALFCINIITAQISFCDDFEGYGNIVPIAETSPLWNTWGELMTGTTAPFIDDANITTTISSSGDFSLYLIDVYSI